MSSREADAADRDKDAHRTNKMARVGRKYAALFELAAPSGTETAAAPAEDWADKLLRVLSSASWADPSFLEELSESVLVRAMYEALPVLKANATIRATATSVQGLADLEESMRKLRHELALAEKRLPSHGVLGAGGSAFYTTWASVGHVCTVMLQALSYNAKKCSQSPAAPNMWTSPAPSDAAAAKAANALVSSAPAMGFAPGEAAATPQAAPPEGQAAESRSPAATPAAAGGNPSSTPRGATPVGQLGGGSVLSPSTGNGSSLPAMATEGALIKLLGNKHVVAHARDVMCAVPEPYKAALARLLLTQISKEMKATQAGLAHILQILRGDPAATSPAPSALPKAWLATAALLTAYCEALHPCLCTAAATPGLGSALLAENASPNPGDAVPVPVAPAASSPAGTAASQSPAAEADGDANLAISEHMPAEAFPPGASTSAPNGAAAPQGRSPLTAAAVAGSDNGDMEMADAPAAGVLSAAAAAAAEEGGGLPSEPAGSGSGSGSSGNAEGAASANAPETSPARKGASCAKSSGTAGLLSAVANSNPQAAVHAAAADDPGVGLIGILQSMASALCEVVTSAHGVGRMVLLLRGEASAKFSNVAAYMPTALSINELMGQLDGLACVATALGASDSIRSSVASLLSSQAIKELLGTGKVYVTTVIAAGALTRDLAIDAVIPQSLRQGYMAAVLTPLETGALLNERRAPQVLAYRNSITESSYYQVMDADALPYGVNVRFEDEQEAEGMGVVREWLSQIAADVFSPDRGLFVRGAADRRVVHPSPQSRRQEDYLGYMRFAGRIVGLALRGNVPLGVVLSSGLFNYLAGRRATLQDLQQIDPQVYTTCQNILSNPGAEALELFHVWHGASEGGQQEQEQELIPGGARLRVTDANKVEYVRLLANHVLVSALEEQCAAFLAGVQDTAHHLPDDARLRRAFLAPLLLEDLNRITAGESTLDPDDWSQHTDVAGFEGPQEQENLDMFWQLVSEYGPEDRQRLLQFWTAMTHLPSGGFKALNQKLQIMKLGPSAARRAAGEAAGDGAVGAAAGAAGAGVAPTSNGHGPSDDGTGPHSHRLDGDGLEVEDQEPSDGMEEGGEDAEPNGTQQQQQGGGPWARMRTPVAWANGESLPGAGVAEAVQDVEANQWGAEEAAAAAAAAAIRAGSSPAPATGGSAHGGAGGDPAGDDPDIPYGEEGEDMGGDEDGMDYGGEEEAEDEFQRQLEMALALSLQDMSAAAPAEAAEAGGHTGAGGSVGEESSGPSGGEDGRGEGVGGSSGQDAAPTAETPATTEAAASPAAAAVSAAEEEAMAAAAAARASAGSPPHASATGPNESGGNAAAGAAACAGHGLESAVGSEFGSGLGAGEAGGGATAALHDDRGGGDAAPGGSGGVGGDNSMQDAAGCPVAADDSASSGLQPAGPEASAAAAATEAADEPGSACGPARELGRVDEGLLGVDSGDVNNAADAIAASPREPSGSAPADPMDTDVEDGTALALASALGSPAADDGAPLGPGAGPEGADVVNPAEGGGPQGGQGAEQEGPQLPEEDVQQRRASLQGTIQEEQRNGGPGLDPEQLQEREQEREQEQERAAGGPELLAAGTGAEAGVGPEEGQAAAQQLQQQAAAADSLRAVAEGGGGNGSRSAGGGGSDGGGGPDLDLEVDAAGVLALSASRVLPLLPQARTCFLQLNLPVYASLEEMRRAFAIALDNMSFGLH